MSTTIVQSSVETTKTDKEELTWKNGEVQDSDLNDVTGGAIPTPVNGQITDSIT